jgi:creatinine amidohydrolase
VAGLPETELSRLRSPQVGSTEQHGPHLPLDVDIRISAHLCREAAAAASAPVLVAPPLPVGVAEHQMGFAGTISLSPESFMGTLYDIGHSLVRHGVERLAIVNGHGGNEAAVALVAQRLRLEGGARRVIYCSGWALSAAAFEPLRESPPGGVAHACEYETSVCLHLCPELVDAAAAVREVEEVAVEGTRFDLLDPGPYGAAVGRDFSRSGVQGDPTLASAEKGRVACEGAVAALARLLDELAADR